MSFLYDDEFAPPDRTSKEFQQGLKDGLEGVLPNQAMYPPFDPDSKVTFKDGFAYDQGWKEGVDNKKHLV